MRTFFRDNRLTIALATMFLLSVPGMTWSGHAASPESKPVGAPNSETGG